MHILWYHVLHSNVKALTSGFHFLFCKMGIIVSVLFSSEGLLWEINKTVLEVL